MPFPARRRAPVRPRRRRARPAMAGKKPRRSAPRRSASRVAATRVTGGGVTAGSVFMPTAKTHANPTVARYIKMSGSPNIYSDQESAVLASKPNEQSSHSWSHLNVSRLKAIRNLITVTDRPVRYVVSEYQSIFTITNGTTAPMELDVYDITLKRDTLQSQYTTSLGTYALGPYPDLYWKIGSQIQSNIAPAGSQPADYLGTSPFDTDLFRQYFNVKKRSVITLPQGAIHRHAVLQKPNFVVTDALLLNYNLTDIMGLSSFTMFVQRGFPTGDLTSGTLLSGGALLNSGIALVRTLRVKYHWVDDINNSLYANQSLAGEFNDVINIGSGQVDAEPKVLGEGGTGPGVVSL